MPYVWGGTTDNTADGLEHGGYDCSGFAWRVYKVSGLPWGGQIRGRTAAEQAGEIPKRRRTPPAGRRARRPAVLRLGALQLDRHRVQRDPRGRSRSSANGRSTPPPRASMCCRSPPAGWPKASPGRAGCCRAGLFGARPRGCRLATGAWARGFSDTPRPAHSVRVWLCTSPPRPTTPSGPSWSWPAAAQSRRARSTRSRRPRTSPCRSWRTSSRSCAPPGSCAASAAPRAATGWHSRR